MTDCPMKIIVEKPITNDEENHTLQYKYKCLDRDVFDTFYDDYIEFKNYINDILKNNFRQTESLFTDTNLHKQQQQQKDINVINTINEVKDKIQTLVKEMTG